MAKHIVTDTEIATFNLLRVKEKNKAFTRPDIKNVLQPWCNIKISDALLQALTKGVNPPIIHISRGQFAFNPKPIHINRLQQAWNIYMKIELDYRLGKDQEFINKAIKFLKERGYKIYAPKTEYQLV